MAPRPSEEPVTGRGPWACPLNPGDDVLACRPRHRTATPAVVVNAGPMLVEVRFADGLTTTRHRYEVYRAGTDTTGAPPANPTPGESSPMSTTATKKTGICASCSLEVDLKRGKIADHPAPKAKGQRTAVACIGSGTPPASVVDADRLPTDPSSPPVDETVVAPTLDQSLLEQNRPDGAWSGAQAAVLDPALCDPDPNNPRHDLGNLDEMALSLVAAGMLEPIIVAPGPTEGRYTIVAGHRRVAAALMANLPEVPALIRVDLKPGSNLSLVAQVVENLHRLPLSPLEEARAYDLLRQLGLKQTDIAAACGVNQGQVSKRLALLKLPDDIAVRVGTDDPGAVDVAAAVEATRLPEAARDKAFDEIRKGVAPDTAVRQAKAASDKATAHAKIIDDLEAAGVGLVDFPASWHWGRDREDRPLATDPDGAEQPYAGARTIDVTWTAHHAEPCHGAAVSTRDEVIYVCLDPTRHGYKTAEQEAADDDAERARVDEERERERALAESAVQARRDAARLTALADVKRPYMTDVVASWIVDGLAADLTPEVTPDCVEIVDILLGWTPEIDDAATDDDEALGYAVAKLVDHHGHLRLAYMTVLATVDGLLDMPTYYRDQLAGGPILRDHFNRLAELAGYEPTDDEHRLISYEAEAPLTLPGDPPDGALAWYVPTPDTALEGDEARWITDPGEIAAIDAAGFGHRLVSADVGEPNPGSSPEAGMTDEGNASPVDDLPASVNQNPDAESEAAAADRADREAADAAHADVEAPPADGPVGDAGDVPTPGERCPASRKRYNIAGSAEGVECPAHCGTLVSTTPSGVVRDHDVPEAAAE